jgi:hypothetical protein
MMILSALLWTPSLGVPVFSFTPCENLQLCSLVASFFIALAFLTGDTLLLDDDLSNSFSFNAKLVG